MMDAITTATLGAANRAVAQATSSAQQDGPLDFGDVLEKAIGQVEGQQREATNVIERFLRGEDVAPYEVVTAAEEAGLALEMLVEMRNKLVEAYRTIVSMQV